MRAHGRQGRDRRRGDGREGPRRGGGAASDDFVDHRAHRRARGRGSAAPRWNAPGATGRQAPTCCSSRHRSREPRSRRSRRRCRSAAALQLRRGWQDAAGRARPAPRARLPARRFSRSACSSPRRRDALVLAADPGGPARRSTVLPSLRPFGEFLDLIGLPEILELERRFGDTTQRRRRRNERDVREGISICADLAHRMVAAAEAKATGDRAFRWGSRSATSPASSRR